MLRNTIGLFLSLPQFTLCSIALADSDAEVRKLLGLPVRIEEPCAHGPEVLPAEG